MYRDFNVVEAIHELPLQVKRKSAEGLTCVFHSLQNGISTTILSQHTYCALSISNKIMHTILNSFHTKIALLWVPTPLKVLNLRV